MRTYVGPVMVCSDVVCLYANIDENRPERSPDPAKCLEAMARIRSLADIVLPAHDSEILERRPGGIVGGPPGRCCRACAGDAAPARPQFGQPAAEGGTVGSRTARPRAPPRRISRRPP